MAETMYGLIQHHGVHHLIQCVDSRGNGDQRETGEEEEKVYFYEVAALSLENFKETGCTGLFRGRLVRVRRRFLKIIAKKHRHTPFAPYAGKRALMIKSVYHGWMTVSIVKTPRSCYTGRSDYT